MMEGARLRAGIIGFGVGKLYAAALRSLHLYYPDLPDIELVAIATASDRSGEEAVRHFGFRWRTKDYRELLARQDIDIVVIATPPRQHLPMLIDALNTSKAIYMDKPLARNLAEARAIVDTARQLGRGAQMIFEFRFNPALALAKQMIDDGRLGQVYAFRGVYFRASYLDPERSLRWKGSMAESGAGVLNDTAPHVIDLLGWLVGLPARVVAQTRIFVPERPRPDGQGTDHVDTDDHAVILGELAGGGLGTIEAGRLIAGSVHDLSIALHGSGGSLRWSLMDPNYLYWAEYKKGQPDSGWRQIPTAQRYPEAALPGWDLPVGMMRFHIASLADFVRRTVRGERYDPGLEQGYRVQAVIQAAADSARDGAWKAVELG